MKRSILICVAILATVAIPARAQTPVDSLASALLSPDFNVRHAALHQINESFAEPMAGSLVNAVVTLLNQEAAAPGSLVGDDAGEYLIELVVAAVNTNDSRAIDGLLKLGGVEISGAVGNFIAGRGPGQLPALDAYALTGDRALQNAVTVYGLMLGRHGSTLSRTDSAAVLARLLAAAGSGSSRVGDELAYIAAQIPLPEFLAVVQGMAANDPSLLEAPRTVARLITLQSATPPMTLLRRLQVSLDGACVGASGQRNGTCHSMENHLDNAIGHLTAGRMPEAKKALEEFADKADKALQHGSFSATEQRYFAATARQVGARL